MYTEQFFHGATFDDFLIRPQKSVVTTRKQVSLKMPLTKRISLGLPLVAANMDTVTGGEMMKTMSLEGGFAFLHRNCSIEQQIAMVADVKKQHSYVIESPLAIHADATVAEAIRMTKEHKIGGLLVEETPGSGILVGILSRRDIEYALMVNDVTSDKVKIFMRPMPLTVASPGVPMSVAEKIMLDSRVEKLPLVEGGNGVYYIRGLITKKDIRVARQKPFSTKDTRGRLSVGAAVGATGDYLERSQALIEAGVDCITIDIAHAHSKVMEQAIDQFRAKCGDVDLVCGNIATGEAAKFLADMGVNAIKVGVGPGRGCRTRLETGFGVPQLQAIREIYLAIGDRIPIIADAGMKNDKDFFLAIACGASTVMSGGTFAGTDESPGELIADPATKLKYKLYRGMTSPEAVIAGSDDGDDIEEKLSTPAEGQSSRIAYVGSVRNILQRIRGHLQSAVSYAGENDLASARTKIAGDPGKYLIRLTGAAEIESFHR